MKLSLQAWMSLGMIITAAYTIVTALKWPFQCALFPLILGIIIALMASAIFVLELLEKDKGQNERCGAPPVDFQLSHSEDRALANQRTWEILLWIVGFVFLILLIGFPLSIPIYFIAFLRLKCRESWRLTLILSGVAWAFFYGLFVSLLNTFFMDGWIQRALGYMGIWK